MKILSLVSKFLKEKSRRKVTNNNAKRHKSDFERWKKDKSLFDDWNERTKIMASYVPKNVHLLEFGAAKLALRRYLHESVIYTPSDIVNRGKGTIVCDLNNDDLPAFSKQDIIFFSGVLEYIFDVPKLINFLANKTNKFIVSYSTLNNFPNKKNRKINGWVNEYSNSEFIDIFSSNNYELLETKSWRGQTIYVFKKLNN